MNIHKSAEDYLESILILSKRNGRVRSIDIVKDLGLSKPSVSVAMRNLRDAGYIDVDDKGHIFLLEPGLQIASKIYEKHTVLSLWLMKLGVDKDTALEDACKMEHVISDASFNAIKEFLKEE